MAAKASAQQKVRNYIIYFTDKNNSVYSVSSPQQFLSQRALERRNKQHIAVTENDLPVNSWYIDSLHNTGAKILFTLKWFNAAAIQTIDSTLIDKINTFGFVRQSERLRKKAQEPVKSIEISSQLNETALNKTDYGGSFVQLAIHNGHELHNIGLQGQGMMIAVIDAGFKNVNSIGAFQPLYLNNQVIATRNFVNDTVSVYKGAMHGMYVLSVIGGYLKGGLIGTAPNSNFILAQSENDTSEFPIEEAAWAAAAEWADSAGADIINSSLGYSTFDDPQFNYTYADMNGKNTLITKAATIAARKGMIVVNSAGNSGRPPWHYITAPADADSILTIGAINNKGEVAVFSSRGPTVDGRVKPDVLAIGVSTVAASAKEGELALVNGTSLSSPVITGLTACLWQAFPEKTNMEIINAIRKSSDHYTNPNDSAGYGIPDFVKAYVILSGEPFIEEKNKITGIYPNPLTDVLNVDFYSYAEQEVKFFISDALGRIIRSEVYKAESGTFLRIHTENLSLLPDGVYFVNIQANDKIYAKKVVKSGRL